MSTRAAGSILIFTLLIAWYAITSAEVIDLALGGADLGRHLKNGELLLSSTAPAGTAWKLLHTNFYSYTQPDIEFVNHHWLAGVIFFAIWKLGGFAGLNACYILLGALSFALFFRIAQEAAGLYVASALALALMPILRARASVRPEVFTLLLAGVFFWILWKHYLGSLGWRALLALPVLEVLWVNLHIGFIFGPVFVTAFLLAELLERPPEGEPSGDNPWKTEFYRRKVHRLGRWLGILALTLAATLANPSGIEGAIYPLTIWTNYGLMMIENQSILVLWTNHYVFEYALIVGALLALYLSFIAAHRRAERFPMALFILAAVVGEMAFMAIRNQTMLGYFSLAAIAINAGPIRGLRQGLTRIALGAIMLAGICYNGGELLMRKQTIGLGLEPGRDAAIRFFMDNRIQGPALNNPNIGGYLIHYLFPRYRVYVDNRPEAYTAAFLQDFYKAPLTYENVWRRLLDQYGFQAIFFSPATSPENDFLARRIQDPAWAAVFADRTAIILVRRTTMNRDLIAKYEIPAERLLAPAAPR